MKRRNFKFYTRLLNVSAALLAILGYLLNPPYTWICFGLAVVAVVAGSTVNYYSNRCPNCGHVIPSRTGTPERCPYCNASLLGKNK